jgi:ribonucleoside-diphosphate reductase alpha chain
MPEVTEKVKTTKPEIAPQKDAKKATGLQFRRLFTKPGVSPYDEIEWNSVSLRSPMPGNVISSKDVEVPNWSMTLTLWRPNICTAKSVRPNADGVRQLVTRVAETIRDWGLKDGYFRTPEDAATFHDELAHILVRQYAAFNSPVWFNVGCDRIEPNSDATNWHWNHAAQRVEFSVTGYSTPQCSACFINSVKDSLDAILTLAKTEGMLFKWGSGTGTNLSPLRSSTETLSGGGTASGPLSFMKGFDAFAGVIKSGGKTRRAAKMVILNVDHPDIIDFIECKSKSKSLGVNAGYDGSSPDAEAYSSIFFQNANNPFALPRFMYAVLRDTDFSTRAVLDGRPMHTFKAKDCSSRFPTPPGAVAIPACSTTPRSIAGTPRRTPLASMHRTRAASTCSSMTPLATSRA